MTKRKPFTLGALLLSFVAMLITPFLAAPAPAAADTSISFGAYGASQSDGSSAAVLSTGVAVLPARIQASLLLPFSGAGRYAVTAEAMTRGPAAVGIGIGAAKLGDNGPNSVVFDALASMKVLPHISVEARIYSGSGALSNSAAFVGARFAL